MSENYKSELKSTTSHLVKFIIFLATAPIVGFAVVFALLMIAAIISGIAGGDGSMPSAVSGIIVFAGFLAGVAFNAIAIIELVKFIKNKSHNAGVIEKHKDEIAAERLAEEAKRKEEEAKRKEEEARRKEEEARRDAQKNQQAAAANIALNTLSNPNSAPQAAATSVKTSSFSQNTTGTLLFELDGGVANVLQIYEDRCTLVAKTTARSYMAGKFFNGTKEFFYEDLTNIQFREATKAFNGYLQFEYPGAVNISNSSFGGTSGNYSSENSFIFSPTSAPEAMRYANESPLDATNRVVGNLYQYMHKRMREEKAQKKNVSVNFVPTASAADELEKYHNLLKNGVITQEEFDAKKKQLFG